MKIVNLSKPRPRGRAIAVAALALAVLSGAAGAAQAAGPGEAEPSYVVRFADLNPARPADAARLLRRIEAAAGLVCGTESVPDLTQRAVWRRCRADAVERAVQEANFPTVTALAHRSATPVALAGE
jgi:UrcA family protein